MKTEFVDLLEFFNHENYRFSLYDDSLYINEYSVVIITRNSSPLTNVPATFWFPSSLDGKVVTIDKLNYLVDYKKSLDFDYYYLYLICI